MPRDLSTISQIIYDKLAENMSAQGITLSTSQVAEYKLWADSVALTLQAEEIVEEALQSDVNNTINNKQPASIDWYVGICKAFQYGDNLTVTTDGVLSYAVIDETKQIIKQASVIEADNNGVRTLVVKVAKDDGNGSFIKLSSLEKTAFEAYFEKRKWAGTNSIIISLDGDTIFYDYTIVYDALYAESDMRTRLAAAIDGFRTATIFNALFYPSSFESAIKTVAGVVALNGNTLTGTAASGQASNIGLSYEMAAGYFNYDVASSLTLIPS